MIEDKFEKIHKKFRISFYKRISELNIDKDSKLTSSESLCAEVIDVLENPTIGALVEFINVSQPNITARVNSLVEKGYVEKFTPKHDRRVVQIKVTEKYRQYQSRKNFLAKELYNKVLESLNEDEMVVVEKVIGILDEGLTIKIEDKVSNK